MFVKYEGLGLTIDTRLVKVFFLNDSFIARLVKGHEFDTNSDFLFYPYLLDTFQAVVFTGVEMAATHVTCRPNSTKAVAYHAACQQIRG